MSYELNDREAKILVQVLDEKYRLEDFTVYYLYREHLHVDAKIGGIADPVGQLINWLWEQIQGALDLVEQSIKNFMTTVRDQIVSSISGAIEALGSTFTNLIRPISDVINSISASLSSLGDTVESWFTSISKSLTDLGSTLTGVTSVLSSVWDFLQGIGDVISEAVSGAIKSFLDTVSKLAQDVSNALSVLQGISSQIVGFFENLAKTIASLPSQILTGVESLLQTITNTITRGFEAFQSLLAKTGATLGGAISQVLTSIQTLGSTLQNAITSGFTTLKNWLWTWLQKAFSNVQMGISQLITGVTTLGSTLLNAITGGFQSLADYIDKTIIPSIEKGFQDFLAGFGDYWSKVEAFFKERYNQLVTGVNTLTQTMQGFVNPLIDIANWFKGFPKLFPDLVSGFIDALKGLWSWTTETAIPTLLGWLKDFWGLMVEALVGLASLLWDGLLGLGKTLTSLIFGGVKSVIEWAKDVGKDVGEFVKNLVSSVMKTLTSTVSSAWDKVIKQALAGRGGGEWEALLSISVAVFFGQFFARWIHIILMSLGEIFDEVKISGNLAIKIIGTGGEQTINITHKLGWILKHIAHEIKEYPDLLGRALIYGIAIWFSQPLTRALSYYYRNYLPLQLPDIPTQIEITRKVMPTRQFNKFLDYMRRFLALWGYSDNIVKWFTTKEEEWYVTITDRFNRQRKLPVSLIYRLPTPSDLARMMVHDIFGPSMRPLPSFKKAMKMVGMNEDIAKMYYMLHFKYPPLEKLWEFACRTAVGLAWVTVKPYKEEDLGAEPALAPAQLNIMAENAQQVKQHLMGLVDKVLKYYAKWHDYATWAWIPNWTSDGLINLDMMADIPMRIDARWMYKWMIIDDKQLFRIVTARAMHPDWIEPITVAEAMNALAEERTYARTGILSSFKEGFMTIENVNAVLANLTTVKILGKDWTVRFLEGEIKLLSLRAKYDRALDILRDFSRDLIRQSAENIITFQQLTSQLKDLTSKIANGLGITLTFDESYWKLYEPVRGALYNIYTIHRIRIWIRYMLYRILTRFSEGYMSKADIRKLINELVKAGKLTDTEKQILTDVSETMLEYFTRRTKAMGILRRLSRGVISTDEALNALTKLGLDKETAQALIDEHAKTYTITIATLMSYADLIHIPEDVMKKKLDLMGVPEDEKELILEVFKLKPIKSELAKVVRAVLDDFEDGYLTEEEAKQKLKELHQREPAINLLIEASKIERDAKIKKYKVDAILYKLRRAEITVEEARRRLRDLIKVPELIEALIEKNVREPLEEVRREYTLSVSTLLSYATLVPVPEDLLKKKMETLGIPKEEQEIILQVFKVRPIRDELATAVRKVLDSFEEGLIDENTCKQNLAKLMKRDVEIQLLVEASKIEKQIKVARAKIDAILSRLRRGAIKEVEARRQLQQLIKDKDMLDALIEKNVRVYTLSPSTLVSMMERVPIPEDWIKEKLKVIGVTEEELKAYLAYAKTAEIEEELRAYMREVANDYVEGFISDEEFRRELDNIATLWGNAQRVLGVDWVFLSPDERKLIFEAYKKRKERKARQRYRGGR